jgi:hypothetical protein
MVLRANFIRNAFLLFYAHFAAISRTTGLSAAEIERLG